MPSRGTAQWAPPKNQLALLVSFAGEVPGRMILFWTDTRHYKKCHSGIRDRIISPTLHNPFDPLWRIHTPTVQIMAYRSSIGRLYCYLASRGAYNPFPWEHGWNPTRERQHLNPSRWTCKRPICSENSLLHSQLVNCFTI